MDITTLDVSWLSGYDLLDGVDVAFHDAQYFDEEYLTHLGWGHSAISHTVTMGRRSNVIQLVLFHHDPSHSDEDLDRLLATAVELWGDAPNPPIVAYEGMVLDMTPAPGVSASDPT
jgi:ribonuclease BN (tRNA processing enzyme)